MDHAIGVMVLADGVKVERFSLRFLSKNYPGFPALLMTFVFFSAFDVISPAIPPFRRGYSELQQPHKVKSVKSSY